MKKYIGILFSAAALFSMSSCEDYFDTVPNDATTLEDVFENRGLTLSWLGNIYSCIPDNTDLRYDSGDNPRGWWTTGSIEGYLPWSHCWSNYLILGTMQTANELPQRNWTLFYRAIQKVNIYLANVEKCEPMPRLEKDVTTAEARALRAYYYYQLVKQFGPVPLIGDRIYDVEDPISDMMIPRSTVDECFQYIIDELKEVIAGGKLFSQFRDDASFNTQYAGNMTQEAAEGILHEAYLFRASYLFNGDPYYQGLANQDGTKLFPQSADLSKWDDVIASGEAIINSGKFSLVYRNSSDKKVFSVAESDPYYSVYRSALGGATNEEMIFYRRGNSYGMDYTMVPHLQHANVNGGGALSVPLQFIDLYFTKKGVDITKDPDYYTVEGKYEYDYRNGNDPCSLPSRTFLAKTAMKDQFSNYTYFDAKNASVMKQFYDREPRFYVDITFQNRRWDFYTNEALYPDFSLNGNCGQAKSGHDYPIFGTISRKLYTTDRGTYGYDVLLRLSEVYLNVAEAYAEKGETQKALEYVNVIRARAGIPGYARFAGDTEKDARNQTPIELDSYDKETVLKAVYRERIIELAYEHKHYFDVRRWGVADGTWRGNGVQMKDGWLYPAYHEGGEGGDMLGFNCLNQGNEEEQSNGLNFYKRVIGQHRIFTKRLSFFPIPQEDINRNKQLVQTTGWAVE